MTDIAAAIEIHQLRRAEEMREQREAIAAQYFQQLGDVDEIELPEDPPNRIHSWHLFPIRLDLGRLDVDRNTFLAELRESGVGWPVDWRPLH
jgi:dTDP-4-amino-4,6-dideoxygalactose transaminase